jgi:hypothetical protein
LSKLPLHLADVRGANADEIEDALCRSRSESPVANQLLVIDHLDAPPKPILQHLEAVSETLLAPFLVILEENAGVGRPPAVHETGLRPGSRALVLERASASLAPCESAGRRDADLVLRVQHVGSGYCEQTIALKYDAAQARISASAQDG